MTGKHWASERTAGLIETICQFSFWPCLRMEVMLQRLHPDFTCVCVCVFPSKLPQTQMEWAQLLESQQRFHDAELQKWREIIKSSVVLLDQVLNRRNSPNLTEVDGNVLKINWRTVHFRFSYANNWWLYNSSIPAVSRGPVPGCMKFQTWIFTGVNYKFKIWA